MRDAIFHHWIDEENKIICIEDLYNTGSLAFTVTNDIENVLYKIKLRTNLPDLSQYKIIYQDSEGIWDEVIHENGNFIDFSYLGEKSEKEAKEKLLSKYI